MLVLHLQLQPGLLCFAAVAWQAHAVAPCSAVYEEIMQHAQWYQVVICMLASLFSPAKQLRGLSRRSTVGQPGWREGAVPPAAWAASLQLLSV